MSDRKPGWRGVAQTGPKMVKDHFFVWAPTPFADAWSTPCGLRKPPEFEDLFIDPSGEACGNCETSLAAKERHPLLRKYT